MDFRYKSLVEKTLSVPRQLISRLSPAAAQVEPTAKSFFALRKNGLRRWNRHALKQQLKQRSVMSKVVRQSEERTREASETQSEQRVDLKV